MNEGKLRGSWKTEIVLILVVTILIIVRDRNNEIPHIKLGLAHVVRPFLTFPQALDWTQDRVIPDYDPSAILRYIIQPSQKIKFLQCCFLGSPLSAPSETPNQGPEA